MCDATRDLRRQKKERRLKKLQALAGAGSSRVGPSHGHKVQNGGEDDSGNEDDEEKDEAERDSEEEEYEIGTFKKPRQRTGSKMKQQPTRDMYKAFDGSALMILGKYTTLSVPSRANAE